MTLTEADIEEFIALCEADGVKLPPYEARAVATRLVLLYRHLARPTPGELQAGLAKRRERATVRDAEPSASQDLPSTPP
jgi:hypothetical protein